MKRRVFLRSLIAAPVAGIAALTHTIAPKTEGILVARGRSAISGNIFKDIKPGEIVWIKAGTYTPLEAKHLIREWDPS